MKRLSHSQIFNVNFKGRSFISALLCFLALSAFSLPNKSEAAVAKLISFQGKITNASSGTNIADGNYSMQFKIYNVASAGTALWTETWDGLSGTTQVAVANGVFSVKLGTYSDLSVIDFTTTPLYLGVNFNPGSGYDGEMSPRKQLTASAYAFNANNLSGDGRIGLAYAPSTTTYNAANISYSPSVASTQSAMVLTSGSNVSGATLNVVQSGTGGAILIGSTSLGGATQTYIGANPSSFTGNFEDFQIGGLSKFKIDASGNVSNAGTLLSTGNITTNGTLTATTSLNLKGATSGTVTIAAQAAAGTYTLTLPTTAGSPNQVLQTDGSGNLSWVAQSGASSVRWDQIQAPTANLALSFGSNTTTFTYGATTGANNLFTLTDTTSNTGTGYLLNLTTATSSTLKPLQIVAAGTSALTVNASALVTANNFASSSAAITGGSINGTTIGATTASTGKFTTATATTSVATPTIALGTAGSAKGLMTLSGNTSGTITLQPQAAAGTYTLTLPNTAGSTNQVLQTDGSGNLSWATFSAGSGARWDQITAPSANLALSMGSFTTAFTYGAATGFGTSLFSLTDSLNNTGTGYLANFYTSSGSSANPLFVNAKGNVVTNYPDLSVDSTGAVIVGSSLGIAGPGSTDGVISFSAPTSTLGYNLVLPLTTGSANQVLQTDGSGNLSWATVAGGSTRWDQIQAPSAGLSLTMGANTTSLAFSAITTGTGFTLSGGTAQTTGTVLAVGSATYVHTAAETGNLSNLTVVDGSTIASGTSITNGLNINTTFNTASGAGTRQLNGINVGAPTFTACSAGNCNWTGLKISVPTTSSAGMTAQGLAIAATGVPKTDLMNISNSGQGVTTAGVNDLSLTYVGGAAAVESGALRIDLTPGTTSGGVWNGFRFVAAATGPASGITETGLKLEGPTTGGAGTYNAINVSSLLPTTSGTVNGLNITGSTAAAGTENGINIANLTAGAGTEEAIKIGTGWDAALDIGGLTTTSTLSGVIKFARSGTTTTTCAGASAQGIVFKNDANTQVAHFCADGTGGMKLYYNAATASSTDVAENYSDPNNMLEPGDVVALSPTGDKSVVPTSGRYDSMVIGVVSTEPGLLLSDINEVNAKTDLVNPKPIALIGRVPTKVSTENGPIKPGDYLTASSVPGVAMKATKAGDTIGRALDGYADTTQAGKILAFIRHGFFEGAQQKDDLNNDSEIYTDTVTATTEVDTAKLAADALEVKNQSLFGGGIKVDSISSISDLITFQNDVEFIGRPYFNSDTGGFAVIRKGDKAADVTFDQEYLGQPIVSAMISQEQSSNSSADDQTVQAILSGDMKYLVRNKSTKGFTIQLNTSAPEDMTFSWIALAVKNPKLFDSATQQTLSQTQALVQTTSVSSTSDASTVSNSSDTTQTPAN